VMHVVSVVSCCFSQLVGTVALPSEARTPNWISSANHFLLILFFR